MATGEVRRRRTQTERRFASEEALLDAAAELIAERGIERASLASIGERAGASRGLPSHHFGSKDALVARLASRCQDRITAATVAAFERADRSIEDATALAVVRTTVDTYLKLFEHPSAEERALLVMWGAAFPSQSPVHGMLDADRRAYEGWSGLIEQGQREGSIRADLDPNATAVVLHGLIRGVAALLITDSDSTDMSRVRETCDAWIATALGTGKAANGHGRRAKPTTGPARRRRK